MKDKAKKRYLTRAVSMLLAFTMLFTSVLAGGDTGGNSGETGTGTDSGGTVLISGGLTGTKVSIIASPKGNDAKFVDGYAYPGGYYTYKLPMGQPAGATTYNDLQGGYPIYFMLKNDYHVEAEPINGSGKTAKHDMRPYEVSNDASQYTSDPETKTIITTMNETLRIHWKYGRDKISEKLGIKQTDGLEGNELEEVVEANTKVFKALGTIMHKHYPNPVTEALAKDGRYETDEYEVVFLLEPIVGIRENIGGAYSYYGMTAFQFMNAYLLSKGANITTFPSTKDAWLSTKKNPLRDSGHSYNGLMSLFINGFNRKYYEGLTWDGDPSYASKIFYQGKKPDGTFATHADLHHAFGTLRPNDYLGATYETAIYYGTADIQGVAGGTTIYPDSYQGTGSLISALRGSTFFNMRGSEREMLATFAGTGIDENYLNSSVHISSLAFALRALEEDRAGYPTPSDLSGQGELVNEIEAVFDDNTIVINDEYANIISVDEGITPITYGLMHMWIALDDPFGSDTALEQYAGALSFIYNDTLNNVNDIVKADFATASTGATSGSYYTTNAAPNAIYGIGEVDNFSGLNVKHGKIRELVAAEFGRMIKSSEYIPTYPLMPNPTANELLNGGGTKIDPNAFNFVLEQPGIDTEIAIGIDMLSMFEMTHSEFSNIILDAGMNLIGGSSISREVFTAPGEMVPQEKMKGNAAVAYGISDSGTPVELVCMRVEDGVPVLMNFGSSGQALQVGRASSTGIYRNIPLPVKVTGNNGVKYKMSKVAVKSPATNMDTFVEDMINAVSNDEKILATNGFDVPVVTVPQNVQSHDVKLSARPEDAGNEPITIVALLEVEGGATVVETYTNEDGSHIKTTKKTIAGEKFEITDKPAESAVVTDWFTSTTQPAGVNTDTPWTTVKQPPRTGTPNCITGTGERTINLLTLPSPRVIYINYVVADSELSGGGSAEARYISFQKTLGDLGLTPYYLNKDVNTGHTIPYGTHTVKLPDANYCDCTCTHYDVDLGDNCGGTCHHDDYCETTDDDGDTITNPNCLGHCTSSCHDTCDGHTVTYTGTCVKHCTGHPCSQKDWVDRNYEVITTDTTDHPKNFIADKTLTLYPFKYGNNKKAGVLPEHPTIGPIDMQIVAHRGEDKVTLAKYKPLGEGSGDLSQLNYKTDNFPTPNQRKTSDYNRTSKFLWKATGGDLEVSGKCDGGHVHVGNMWANKETPFDIDIAVYRDKQNEGLAKATTLNPSSIDVAGEEIQNVKGVAAPGSIIEFYPYVEMLYETSDKEDIPVYVLSDEKSRYQVNDYAEIGWTKTGGNNLMIKSNQFSTHKSATSGSEWRQKNKVLPGGAIFGVTNSNSGRTVIGLSTHQTYIPSDVLNAPGNAGTLGSDYNLNGLKASDKVKVHEDMENALKQQMSTVGLEMMVNKSWNSGLTEAQGAIIAGKGKTVNLDYSRTLSTDNKYWLQARSGAPKNTDKNFDINEVASKTTYYKVHAEPTKLDATMVGDIVISKSSNGSNWSEVHRFDKTKTKSQILSSLNSEIKAVNDRTLFVTNFVDAISRTSSWYSEAWDGICVIKQDTAYEFGLFNPDTRLSVLDVKLTPKQQNISDMFSKAFGFGFRSEKKSVTVPFINGKNITLTDVHEMATTDKYYIPNATTMDIDR